MLKKLCVMVIAIVGSVESITKCVRAKGQVQCDTDPDRHGKVRIMLMDKDGLPWESDDEMGRTFSDDDGNFVVEGCADDFGPWNEPDPYIIVHHRCPSVGQTVAITHRKTIVIPLWKTFLPQDTRVGVVRLDQYQGDSSYHVTPESDDDGDGDSQPEENNVF